jgi:lipoprotein signal peptidase
MTTVALTLLAVLVADHAIKWALLRTLGPRSLSLGALGGVQMRRAPIWFLRGGVRLGPATLWSVWLAAAGTLVLAGIVLPAPGWSIGLLLGGSLSHAVETWWRGSVVDYVELHGGPVFDLADVAIAIGGGSMLMALAVTALRTLT